ncbi:MAG: branched-chain amino acid ABC transporter permease [Lachnospirales bacterium]
MKILKYKKVLFFLVACAAVYFTLITLMSTGYINNFYQGLLITIFINIILVASLNLTMGFLGQLALGHAGFMAVGAYTSALIIEQFRNIFGDDINYIFFDLGFFQLPIHLMWFGIIFGGLVAVVFGVIIGVPTLRLHGDYLAIVTLAFNEIIKSVLNVLPFTGGAKGMLGIPKYTTFNVSFIACVICLSSIFLLIKSRHGRAIISIREDEIAAEASGINTVYYKLFAFCFSAFFAGVAGSLYAHYFTYLSPSDFDFNKSIEIAIMTVFGGLSNLYGSIVSATVLTALPQILIPLQKWRMLIYSVILILFMVLRANGTLDLMKLKLKRNNKKEV